MVNNFSKAKQHQQKFGTAVDYNEPGTYQVTKDRFTLENIDEWAKQINFWRTHLDVFIEDYFSDEENQIKFYPFQSVKVRSIGNDSYIVDDESRGLGKTYTIAWCCIGLSVLYPENKILCLSNSGHQATLVLSAINDIYDKYKNVRREIEEIKLGGEKKFIKFHNLSKVFAKPMGKNGASVRGTRAKIIILDEGLLIKNKDMKNAVEPVINCKRDVVNQLVRNGFDDYEDFSSKIIEMSSAFYKWSDHFGRLRDYTRDMLIGKLAFTCCLPYTVGLHHKLFDSDFIEEQKRNNTKENFDMEYGCRHIGSNGNGVYPYELVMSCRTSEVIELKQTNKKSRYIIAADIATSKRNNSDNAVICVVKITERSNGTFFKKLVFIRSYNGFDLKDLTNEIRRIAVLFPSTEMIVIDSVGLGEGVVSMLELPYSDAATKKEYPSYVRYDMDCSEIDAVPIVFPFKGNPEVNSRGVMALKMFMEDGSLTMPIPSISAESLKSNANKSERVEEMSVLKDVDALMFELTNLRTYKTVSSVRYGVPKGDHKDRFSALMMACYYIYLMEQDNKQNRIHKREETKSCALLLDF